MSADFIGVGWDFKAVTDGERRAGFFDHLFGLVERVDGKREDVGVLLFKLLDM